MNRTAAVARDVLRRAVCVACALAVTAAPVQGAVIPITNTLDSGAGSLRAAITASNALGGDTLQWQAGSGGILSLFSDATLNVNTTLDVTAAPASVAIQGADLGMPGVTTFINGTVAQPWTISTNLFGSSSLVKTGAGTLLLSGGNSYVGGTTLSAGTLGVYNSGSLGSGGTLTFDGGTLQIESPTTAFSDGRLISINATGGTIDTAGSTATFSGVISGLGALTQSTTGTLILSGINTYTGGTTVTGGGVLSVAVDGNLGGAAGVLTLNNGTLQAFQPLASGRAITLGAGGGIIDTNGYQTTLSGAIGGACPTCGLTKINSGTLILAGANNYGGATAIQGGILQLGANDALPAGTALTMSAGTLFQLNGFSQATNVLGAVSNAGMIDVGGGTLKLNTYTGAGTLATVIQNGVTPITGTGAATLTGGTLQVTLVNTPAHPIAKAGDTFTPMTAAGGFGGTTFASVVSNSAALSFTPAYVGNNVVLTVNLVPFATLAASGNQAAIGGALEPLRANPTGDSLVVMSRLYALDGARLQQALDQIGPVALGAMSGVSQASAGVQSSAVGRRMTALAGRPQVKAPNTMLAGGRVGGPMLASAPGDVEAQDPKSDDPNSPWGFFGSGVGSQGRLAEAHSDSGVQPGYAFNSAGVTAGGDYRLDEHLAIGAAFGYLHGHASLYTPALGTVDDDSAHLGVYAATFGRRWHLNGYLGGATDAFTTQRGIIFADIARMATGHPHGTELNASFDGSFDLPTRDYGTFSPFAGLNYDRLMMGAFTETGADSLDLSVSPQTAESLRSSLGLKDSMRFEDGGQAYIPYVSAAWRHEFKTQSRPIDAQLASGTGSFQTKTGAFARDGTLVGLGIAVELSRRFTLKADYTGDFRSHFLENAFEGTVRFRF